MAEPLPLSLYVHVPWCVRKCGYCDFNSHELRGELPEDDYLLALIDELDAALPSLGGRRFDSVFFGGGTPSLLSAKTLDSFLDAVRVRAILSPDAEITVEANPGTVEATKFAAFRSIGINRLSIGVQSFDSAKLLALGRIHDGDEARRAIEIAATHFDNFNIDLMYGLPEQSLEQALSDLATALTFAPPHLSCYQLTLEPHTAFAAAPPKLPSADLCADMHEAIENVLSEAGFAHYETSAFARSARQCRHNLNYWKFGDYLGIGAGAHSKLTFVEDGWRIVRQMRWKQPQQYLSRVATASPIQESFELAEADLPFEFMMNALRLNQGFDRSIYPARTGLSLDGIESTLASAEQDGFIVRTKNRMTPTVQGRRFLNRLLQRFLPDLDS